jgi:hypothetical protein
MARFSASRLASGLVALSTVILLSTSAAQAQATRTWVSGVGDDANPCSRTAPCKTFAGAISKTAARGEISVLDPGGFGAVTITKSISIVADGAEGGILAAGTNGIIINAAASDTVSLRGLVIEGAGTGLNGIRFLAGGALQVEDCVINGFTLFGIDFEPSGASELFVRNTEIRNNQGATGGGILVKPSGAGTATALIDQTSMVNNRFGVRAEAGSKVTVRSSSASGNLTNGFLAVTAAGGVELNLENVIATANVGAGVRSEGGAAAVVRISDSFLSGNANGLQSVGGGQIISFGNNRNNGNTNNGAVTSTVAQQ